MFPVLRRITHVTVTHSKTELHVKTHADLSTSHFNTRHYTSIRCRIPTFPSTCRRLRNDLNRVGLCIKLYSLTLSTISVIYLYKPSNRFSLLHFLRVIHIICSPKCYRSSYQGCNQQLGLSVVTTVLQHSRFSSSERIQ